MTITDTKVDQPRPVTFHQWAVEKLYSPPGNSGTVQKLNREAERDDRDWRGRS